MAKGEHSDGTALGRARAWLAPGEASGVAVAQLYRVLFAGVLLAAWASLGAQVHTLYGSRGLLPIREWAEVVRARHVPWHHAPSLFRWASSDGVLVAVVYAGIALALVSLVWRRAARVAFALSAVLYLSYAEAGRDFLAFQWDGMLVECAVLGALLPTDRASRIAHFAMRVLLFKLYFESGLAKWGSHLHDWHDGSAMRFYYETAPLPSALAWYAHHLPAWWHGVESRLTLVVELVVPFAVFAGRRLRLAAFAVLTGFQLVNLVTANYGFFVYLALALHVFLLDDADVVRARDALVRQVPEAARARVQAWRAKWALGRAKVAGEAREEAVGEAPIVTPLWPQVRRVGAIALLGAYMLLSLLDALTVFAQRSSWAEAATPLARRVRPFRVVNTYHLFGHITRERIEPEFQVEQGGRWVPLEFRYKAGDVRRRPRLVAPHQPRVGFRLWFYGLSFGRGAPLYVQRLGERLCEDPGAVQSLFETELPRAPSAVRIVFWDYRFSTAQERRATGAIWTRREIDRTGAFVCPR